MNSKHEPALMAKRCSYPLAGSKYRTERCKLEVLLELGTSNWVQGGPEPLKAVSVACILKHALRRTSSLAFPVALELKSMVGTSTLKLYPAYS